MELKDRILKAIELIEETGSQATFQRIVREVYVDEEVMAAELFRLFKEGIITWAQPTNVLSNSKRICIVNKE